MYLLITIQCDNQPRPRHGPFSETPTSLGLHGLRKLLPIIFTSFPWCFGVVVGLAELRPAGQCRSHI